jgi:hypothetical protein
MLTQALHGQYERIMQRAPFLLRKARRADPDVLKPGWLPRVLCF